MTNELKNYASDIFYSVVSTLNSSGDLSNTEIKLNKDKFKEVRNESIDYAVLENHKNGKREKVWTQDLNNFDSSLYKSERLKIKVRDGKKVPVSLVYKKISS